MKNATFVSVLLTLLIASLFFAVSAGPALTSQGSQIQANSFTASQGIQPYMTMNTNITWSTFNNGWSTMEYSNGTANLTLNTGLSTFYQNPITANTQYLQTSFPNEYAGIQLYNKTLWSGAGAVAAGAVQSTTNTSHSITYSVNESNASYSSNMETISIPTSDLPSANAKYDYFTIAGNITAYTGMDFSPLLGNSTRASILGAANGSVTIIGQSSNPIPGGQAATTEPFWISASLSQANLTLGTSSIKIGFVYTVPQTTADKRISVTINNIAITEEPMTLGSATINGTKTLIAAVLGNAHLVSLNPDFTWSKITNSGYSVATSQPLLNTTISQTAISNGSYIEEVQTQGQFKLPSAPDLTYGSANITEQLNVSSSQVLVLDINGLSYLSSISGKNGTINLIGSVNPTSSTSFLEIVEYTSSQWNSISGPPGFFSVAGVEYYFDEIVLGLTALLGIGGAAAHRRAAQLRRVK